MPLFRKRFRLDAIVLVVALGVTVPSMSPSAGAPVADPVASPAVAVAATPTAAPGTPGAAPTPQSTSIVSPATDAPGPISTVRPTTKPVAAGNGSSSPTAKPTKPPTATPKPVPPPVTGCGTTLQARIDATGSGGTVNLTGCSYSGTATISKAMTVVGGTLSVPSGKTGLTIKAANVTVKSLTVNGGGTAFGGIWGVNAAGLSVDGVHVTGFVYAGIMFISVSGGSITNSVIKNIGVTGWEANNMNAYGIALTDQGGVPTSDTTVARNTIDNVPTWEGIDTHGGRRLTIVDNVIHRTNRAIRIVTSGSGVPQDITISRNTMDKPTRRPDVTNNYPYNEVGITVEAGALRVTGTGNIFDGWPKNNHIDTSGGPNTFTNSVIKNPT